MRICALVFMLVFGYANADFTANCPRMCVCKWQSGTKAADCSQGELNEVPDQLSGEIQSIKLSNNPLFEISPRAFESVGLSNLKKLWLHDCKLTIIDEDGFSGLSIMLELDVSKNNIKTLHPNTFNELKQLRHLIISENKLEKIEDGLFHELPHLLKIDLRNNFIYMLGTNSFGNLPRIRTIFLQKNNLSHVELDTFNKLKSIASLVLYDNPWKCDCNLRPFTIWVIDYNLDTRPTLCAHPDNLRNRLWIELSSEDFACRPTILEPFKETALKTNDRNITLSCYVDGDPTPEVNWIQNSKTLGYNSTKNHVAQRYVIKQSKPRSGSVRWTNLTITSVEYEDSGEYTCIAKNRAGVDKRTVSLNVSRTPVVSTRDQGGETVSNTLTLRMSFMGITVGIIPIVVFLLYIYYEPRDNKKPTNLNNHSSKREVLGKVQVKPEMQKNLLTTMNVMNKPTKKYNMTSAVTSGAIEMSNMTKVLLEKGTVLTTNEDVSHPIVLSDQILKHAKETVSVHSPRALHTSTIMSRSQTSPVPSISSMESNSNLLPLHAQAQSSSKAAIPIYENLSYSRSYFSVAKESAYENIIIRKTNNRTSVYLFNETQL